MGKGYLAGRVLSRRIFDKRPVPLFAFGIAACSDHFLTLIGSLDTHEFTLIRLRLNTLQKQSPKRSMNIPTDLVSPKKRFLPGLLIAVCAFLCVSVFVPQVEAATDGFFNYSVADGNATVTEYTGTSNQLVIPGTLGGFPVTAIGDQALAYSTFTSVTMPNTVVSIVNSAFRDSTSLTTVTLSTGLITIGNAAFEGCIKLRNIALTNSIASIGERAFANCKALVVVAIPPSVTSLGMQAYIDCSSLTTVTIPESITYINYAMFSRCKKLTKVTIPASVTGIDAEVFYECIVLADVTIPSSVTSIGAYAFGNCHALTRANFLGNAPSTDQFGSPVFDAVSSSFTLYRTTAATGFNVAPWTTNTVNINDFPVANDQTANGLENTALPILLAASDSNGDALTYEILTSPSHGTLTGTMPNLSYQSPAGYSGNDSFTFRVNDGILNSGIATVSIVINDPPVANSISATTRQDTPVEILLTASDLNGNVLTYSIINSPTKGILTGTLPNLTYSPTLGASGSDSFTFSVNDGTVDSALATASITIEPAPPLPWDVTELGNSKFDGFTIFKAGVFTQAGSGALGTTSDKFRFTHQKLSGDGEIIARVTELQNTGPSSRVGVMIRNTLAVNSQQVFIGLSGTGAYRYVERKTSGGKNEITNSATGSVPQTWLKLERSANELKAYKSTNGKKWILVDSVKMNLAKNCFIGLAVASGSDATLNTSEFSNVKVKP